MPRKVLTPDFRMARMTGMTRRARAFAWLRIASTFPGTAVRLLRAERARRDRLLDFTTLANLAPP